MLVASFSKIFSESVDGLFVLFMVSFAVQKLAIYSFFFFFLQADIFLLVKVRFHLFIFAFLSIGFKTDLRKHFTIYVRECFAYVVF